MKKQQKQNPCGAVVSTIRIDLNERGITTGLQGKRSPLVCEMAAYLSQCATEYIRQNNVDNPRKPDDGNVATRKIGSVAVDTGRIVILDPCRGEELNDWMDGDVSQFVVSSSTGLGDGRYPVFADIATLPNWGERVVGIHIDCNPMYCFADDPKFAKKIKEYEAEILSSPQAVAFPDRG